MHKPFNTYISQSSLDFCPGGDPTKFWVAVQNNSPDYASFKFDLTSAGDNNISSSDWYRMLSADSYTIPPQDCVKFEVQILKLPPGREGFVGVLSLRANIYSPETDYLEHQTLKLQAAGIPPVIRFIDSHIQAVPESQVAIALEITNPNDQPISMDLGLASLPKDWLRENPTNLILKPKATQIKTFNCYIPTAAKAPEGQYPFSAEILQSDNVTTSETALLEIIPTGHIELQCDVPHQTLPTQPGRWFNQHHSAATFPLTWTNHSNITTRGHLNVAPIPVRPKWRQWLQPEQFEPISTDMSLPIGTCSRSPVTIDYQPPWLGWGRYQKFEIQDIHTEPAVEVQNHTPILSLRLLPIIPRWLQGLGIFGVLVLVWLLFQGPRTVINHAEFSQPISKNKARNQVSETTNYSIISGSEDGTLSSWKINTQFPWISHRPTNSLSTQDKKFITVVRYRPPNSTEVVAGFKNGELRAYDWHSQSQIYSLDASEQEPCQNEERFLENIPAYKGDRIFDLVFSKGGQYLYSAHGSGRILRWNFSNGQNKQIQAECLQSAKGNTVTALKLLERDNTKFLASAGQRNHLTIFNLEKASDPTSILTVEDSATAIRKDDHILTIDSPQGWPSIIATGDTRGTITLLDINNCSDGSTDCILDTWQSHDDRAVRSVSFTDDGCYLASAGDDGRVVLWPMEIDLGDKETDPRLNRFPSTGYVARQSRQRFTWHPFQLRSIETVDLLIPLKLSDNPDSQDELFIISGGQDRQLRQQKKSISDLNQYFGDHNCQAPQ